MTTYYTEYPKGQFEADNHDEALRISDAKVIYIEIITPMRGKEMIVIRDTHTKDVY